MKRIVIVLIVIMVVISVGGSLIYISETPEYAMIRIIHDVQEDGVDGLLPHLTGQAREVMDVVSSLSQSKLIKTIGGLISRDDRVKTVVEEIRKIQWGVEDILKSRENAQVVLSFNYKDRITGTVGLSMIKVAGEWKISGLEIPKFDDI